MKKFIKYPILLLCALSMVSCAEDFLNRYPSKPTTGDFFQSEEAAKLALTGIYNGLYLWSSGASLRYRLPAFAVYDGLTGLVVERDENETLGSGRIWPDDGTILSYWKGWYVIVQRANTLLFNANAAQSENMARYTAEARVLRAMAYYYLIAMFGDVPFFTEPPKFEDFKCQRTSKVTILDFVLKELDESAKILPDWIASERGRVDKAAAYGLMSRAALMGGSFNYNNDAAHYFKIAAESAEKVIGKRELYKDFGSLFTTEGQANAHSELIMEACFYATGEKKDHYIGFTETSRFAGQTGRYPTQTLFDTFECIDGKRIDESSLYDPTNPKKNRDPRLYSTIFITGDTITVNTGSGKLKVILNAYEGDPNDKENYRKTLSYNYTTRTWEKVDNLDFTDPAAFSSFANAGKGYMCAKFQRDSTENIGQSTVNFPILRYAEVLLNFAEAKIELWAMGAEDEDDRIYTVMNEVRNRAGMPDVSDDRKGNVWKMRQLVRRERKVEFAFEGLHLIDLRRWDIGALVNSQPIYGMPEEKYGGFKAPYPSVQKLPKFGEKGDDYDLNDIAIPQDPEIRLVRDKNRKWEPHYRLWPIPQSEVSKTGMSQNPGYAGSATDTSNQ